MKNVKKYIIVSIAAALLMIVFAVLMIMYDRGVFEISFIKRDEHTTAEQTQTDTEPETETDTEITDTLPDDSGEVTDEDEVTADQSVFDNLHNAIPAVNGRIIMATDKTYDDKTMTVYRLDTVTLPEETLSGGLMTRTRYSVTKNGVKRTFKEEKRTEVRRSVDVYMGMFVVADGGSLSFYNSAGVILYKYTGTDELVFAYERDKEDRPLFILNGEYYYIDPGAKTLVKSDFEKKDSRGLYYNYPADFGKDAEKVRFRDYYAVEQKDEGGIGSVYLDGGYVMVRSIKYERDDEDDGKCVEDMEVIVNADGKKFDLPEGYRCKAYSDQRILVEKGGKYGFYAVKGAWIADSKYTYATPYYEGLAVVGSSSFKGVIDLEGNFVIPMSYSYISVCSGGIIVCWSSQTGYEIYIKAENQVVGEGSPLPN